MPDGQEMTFLASQGNFLTMSFSGYASIGEGEFWLVFNLDKLLVMYPIERYTVLVTKRAARKIFTLKTNENTT